MYTYVSLMISEALVYVEAQTGLKLSLNIVFEFYYSIKSKQ